MTPKRKAKEIAKILDELYPETPIPLQHEDAYTLLVAVVLSAQCTDVRVNQITPLLFARADNPQDMIKLSVEEIREIIMPCGLSPAKSKAIWGLSKILVEKYNGQVPQSFEALEALPGVGHKTASVVMSQAFGVPAFPVDTHIHRLAARWGLSDGKKRGKNGTRPESAIPGRYLEQIAFANHLFRAGVLPGAWARQGKVSDLFGVWGGGVGVIVRH
jgi:endonuclease-3